MAKPGFKLRQPESGNRALNHCISSLYSNPRVENTIILEWSVTKILPTPLFWLNHTGEHVPCLKSQRAHALAPRVTEDIQTPEHCVSVGSLCSAQTEAGGLACPPSQMPFLSTPWEYGFSNLALCLW